MLQKCMLTGAMCAIAPGSPVQLLVAVFVCLAYLLLVFGANPYKGSLEDRLAFLTSLCLSISLILGFALITDDKQAPVFDVNTAGMVLILINVLPFPYCIFAVSRILKFGPNYGVPMPLDVGGLNSGPIERLEDNNRPVRIKMKRQLSVVEMRQAVTREQVFVLQTTSNKHREAHIARIKEREARADARVKMRLAERKAAKAKSGRSRQAPLGKTQTKKTTTVTPVVNKPMSEKLSPLEIRNWDTNN